MRDVLQACLTTRGHARGLFVDPQREWKRKDATVLDAVKVVLEKADKKRISKRPRVALNIRLIGVGSAKPLLATDEERVAANKDWE